MTIRRKILLVEDNAINRLLMRRLLRELNLEVEEAENGDLALEYFRDGKSCDLILMDKDMPLMGGHEATRRLRLMGVTIPIVALSADDSQLCSDHFFDAGANEFLTKPLTKERLVQALARYHLD